MSNQTATVAAPKFSVYFLGTPNSQTGLTAEEVKTALVSHLDETDTAALADFFGWAGVNNGANFCCVHVARDS